MKKLIFAIFALGAIAVMPAQKSKSLTGTTEKGISKTIDVTQDFTEVKLEKLPEAVTAAVTKDFKDFKLVKAYVNPQGQYKLQLASITDKKAVKTVYADSKGNWIQKETNRSRK